MFDRTRWLEAARARNRTFVGEVNARTVCAHCGAQPIEWHNPEHVQLGREGFRIGTMLMGGSTIGAIKSEMARCTPLCRRCHMAEDGRLAAFAKQASAPRAEQTAKPCTQCGQPYKPLRRGLCRPCYRRQPERIEQSRKYDRQRKAGGIELPGMENT